MPQNLKFINNILTPQNLKFINNILKIQGDCFHWASSKRCKYEQSRLGSLQVSKIEIFPKKPQVGKGGRGWSFQTKNDCRFLQTVISAGNFRKNPQQCFSKRDRLDSKLWSFPEIHQDW